MSKSYDLKYEKGPYSKCNLQGLIIVGSTTPCSQFISFDHQTYMMMQDWWKLHHSIKLPKLLPLWRGITLNTQSSDNPSTEESEWHCRYSLTQHILFLLLIVHCEFLLLPNQLKKNIKPFNMISWITLKRQRGSNETHSLQIKNIHTYHTYTNQHSFSEAAFYSQP